MTPVGARSRATGVARLSTVHRALVPECTQPASDTTQKQPSGILIRFGEILRVEGIGSAAFSCVRLLAALRFRCPSTVTFTRLTAPGIPAIGMPGSGTRVGDSNRAESNIRLSKDLSSNIDNFCRLWPLFRQLYFVPAGTGPNTSVEVCWRKG
jgi:hypothetical protein